MRLGGALGILMLDTSFARPIGDAGNPASWPFPVLIERVAGADAQAAVLSGTVNANALIQAGHRLIARGAIAITSTCGFLVRHQQALSEALRVPVACSTLTRHRAFEATLAPGRRLAILTIDASAFDSTLRGAADIDDSALVYSLPRQSHFVSAILDERVPLDSTQALREWIELATRTQRENPDIGAWLFECANMPPYAAAVSHATRLPVYDALALGRELFAAAAAAENK